jgi:hypothetical protein
MYLDKSETPIFRRREHFIRLVLWALKIVIWNVHGLNARARRLAIRALLATTNATIVCFQETKINLFHSGLILETLGPDFDDYVYLPVDGTRCGILLAWQSRTVAITDPIFTTNALSAKVTAASAAPWWIHRRTPTRFLSSRSCVICAWIVPAHG